MDDDFPTRQSITGFNEIKTGIASGNNSASEPDDEITVTLSERALLGALRPGERARRTDRLDPWTREPGR
jgi:hypothetical protein